MRSVTQSAAKVAHVPGRKMPRSIFDRSHAYKSTFDAGFLYPVLIDETLPGDTFNLRTAVVARIETLLHPIMDNVFVDFHYFFVPYRLVWDNFVKMMGERRNPTDSIDYMFPEVDLSAYGEIQPDDLFGYALSTIGVDWSSASRQPNALYFRAYNLIWNEWFRAEQLQDSLVVPVDDGPDDPADYVLVRRGKRHDYFTSALPSPQMGPSVPIATGNVPVFGDGISLGWSDGTNLFGTSTISGANTPFLSAASYGDPIPGAGGASVAPSTLVLGITTDPDNSGLTFDASAIGTINTLREAATLQQFFETDNVFGTRYTESVYGHFGVHTGDYRLQRPEYIGGGSKRIAISTVPQSSASEVGSPQGSLAAFGVAGSDRAAGFNYTCVEHGMIIGLMSFRGDITWQRQVRKMWTRAGRFDIYSPEFAHLGEQPILSKELYMVGNEATDDTIFGYIPRWEEYRSFPSVVTGKFASDATGTLDSWHLAINFDGSSPSLNAVFIQDNPPIDRVIAVANEPQFIAQLWHDYKCVRPMPVYGIPGLNRF